MTEPVTAPATPKRVLVIQAHPDDAEFTCGGTVAKWTQEGAEVHYCSITSGDKGSSDAEMTPERLVALREREQRAAADVLGVKSVIYLGYKDATLVADLDLRRDLTRVMRQVKPDAILTFDPTMRYVRQEYINHPDHIAAGDASLAAVFPSVRDRMTFPELLNEGLEPHKVAEVYLYSSPTPDVWIDITATMETKIAALKAHASQVDVEKVDAWMREWGRGTAAANPNGTTGEYAEAFKYIKLD